MEKEKFYTGVCDETLVKEKTYLSTYIIGNSGNYEGVRGNLSVFWVDEENDICRQIVDKWGNIRNFPGIIYDEKFVEEFGKHKLDPVVRFGSRFARCADGRYVMAWMVRPDGSYWSDSWGFGREDYEAICLYSIIDNKGNFVQPFKLHTIGKQYFGEYKF